MHCVGTNFIIILVLFTIENSSTGIARTFTNHCRLESECVNLKDCAPFMNLTQKSDKTVHPVIFKFLKTQLCGFIDNKPKVCCSQLPLDLKKIQHMTNIASKKKLDKTQNQCKAPLKCMKLSDCKSTKQLNRQLTTFQRCDLHLNYIKICCLANQEEWNDMPFSPITGTVTRKPEQSTTTKTTKMSLAEKAEAINRFYLMEDFIDYMAFDLMRRKRKLGDSEIDIEIR